MREYDDGYDEPRLLRVVTVGFTLLCAGAVEGKGLMEMEIQRRKKGKKATNMNLVLLDLK